MRRLASRLWHWLVQVCPDCGQSKNHFYGGGWYYDPRCHTARCVLRILEKKMNKDGSM